MIIGTIMMVKTGETMIIGTIMMVKTGETMIIGTIMMVKTGETMIIDTIMVIQNLIAFLMCQHILYHSIQILQINLQILTKEVIEYLSHKFILFYTKSVLSRVSAFYKFSM